MGSTPRVPRGGLPAPPRRNLTAGTVKDSVRKSLAGPPETRLAPEDIKELLQRVAMEEARSPGEGSAGPYVAALQELPGQEGARILQEAFPDGVPDVFSAVMNPMDLGSLSDIPDAPLVDFATLTPSQQRAVKSVLDMASAYERARKEFMGKFSALTPEQQALVDPEAVVNFDKSQVAQDLRARIFDTIVMSGLDPEGILTGDEPVGYVARALAPEASDLPEPDGTQRMRATRADIPMGEKLSTYMGDRANDFIVKDEALTGGRVGNLGKLAGAQMRKMLVLAGWDAKTVRKMPIQKVVALVTAKQSDWATDGQGRRSPTSMTTKVVGPNGSLVEVTLPQVRTSNKKSPASKVAAAQEKLAAMEGMPPIQDDPSAEPGAIQSQRQRRASDISALKGEIAKLQQTVLRAPGDTPKAAKELRSKIQYFQGLPIDPSADQFGHVLDQRLRLTPDEINQLPAEVKLAVARGEIQSLDDLIAALPEDMADSSSRMLGPSGEVPTYGSGDSKISAKEDEMAMRGTALAARQTPYASIVEQIRHRMATETPRFATGLPSALPSEDVKQNLVAYLTQNLRDMQARMSKAKPVSGQPQPPMAVLKAQGGSADALRSPAQVKAEQWLSASGAGTTETRGLMKDPVTGERTMLGADQYFQDAAEAKEPPKIPGFLYAAAPSVDASGNVAHSGQSLDPKTAAETIGWTLGAQDPSFASTIQQAVGDALERDYGTVPTGREPGQTVFRTSPDPNSQRPMMEVATPSGRAYREQMMPGPSGLAYLQGLAQQQGGVSSGIAGGGAGGGRLQVEVAKRPSQMIDDSRAPTISELMAMPVEDPPDSPPPMPGSPEAMTLEQLDALAPEGDMDEAIGPATQTGGRPSQEDINRMLEEIQVDDDDTGFLRQTSMNRVPRRPVLSGLLA